MKILVYPHSLSVGGSQLNAIELAGAVRDLGHEVVVFGQPGPLVEVVSDLGLPYVSSPQPGRRPAPTVVRALTRLSQRHGFDVLHGYEWPPALECHLAGMLGRRSAAVCTVMSMGVAPFIPSGIPMVVGTERLRAHVAPRRRAPVTLVEPPVDTRSNKPGAGARDFAGRYGLSGGDLHVVVVSRLSKELKLEGLLEAIHAVGMLAREVPVRLLVVGDGPAWSAVAATADEVNRQHGKPVVVMTGELLDPRPAYELADVALGMGGSALRAMAFERPLVVQGERGFWEELNPHTVQPFLHQGWYGVGDGSSGTDKLGSLLRTLLADAGRRRELGGFGRRLVVERFSLERAAQIQEQVYVRALAQPSVTALLTDSLWATAGFARHEVARRWRSAVGREVSEDFNAVSAQPEPTGSTDVCPVPDVLETR